MKQIITILLLLLAIGGCSTAVNNGNEIKNSLENTTIILERGHMFTMQEYSFQRYTITNEGIKYETFYPNMTQSGGSFVKFENNEYQTLIDTLKQNKYSELKSNYTTEIMVADIGYGMLKIQTAFGEKNIKIDPYITEGNPQNIQNIMETLQNVTMLAKDPISHTTLLQYQGKQCEDEPWQTWYANGNINFIKAPTDIELITAYYSSKDIELLNISKEETTTCEACNICLSSTTYTTEVYNYALDEMLNGGWTLAEQ